NVHSWKWTEVFSQKLLRIFVWKLIKEYLLINEEFIGEKFGLFGENEHLGSDYIFDWKSRKESDCLTEDKDILDDRCHGGTVPLDYSLRSFLEVIYLNPRMKIYVQGSLIVDTTIKEKHVHLTLGLCGRDCKSAYKRVWSMVGGAEPGLIGVIDVITDIMNDGDDEWLGHKTNEYIDTLHAEWCQWYCCMPPYNGIRQTPEEEQVVDHGISSVGGKRTRFYGPWDTNLPN
ncbi:hypothetical protein MKW92_011414, partial [Papaver armeniacum]